MNRFRSINRCVGQPVVEPIAKYPENAALHSFQAMPRLMLCVVLLSFCRSNSSVLAQTDSLPESFFPSEIGNVWNYGPGYDTAHTYQTKLTRDSVASGLRFLFFDASSAPRYMVDPSFNVADLSTRWLQYKLSAKKGESWTVLGDSTGRIVARVDSFQWGYVLGRITQIKGIGYYSQRSDTTNFSVWLYEDYLAAGFGLILEITDAMQTPNLSLLGCIINGIRYGKVSAVEHSVVTNTPADYSLSHAFPNPFNPVTTLMYRLPVRGHVVLNVCDVLGRQVASLVDDIREPGTYAATFDASNLAGGVYFCRMQSAGFVEVKKLLLIK